MSKRTHRSRKGIAQANGHKERRQGRCTLEHKLSTPPWLLKAESFREGPQGPRHLETIMYLF